MLEKQWIAIILFTGIVTTQAANTGIDSEEKYAWGENIGWCNAGATNYGVQIHFDGTEGWLSGFIWGESVGWIKVGGDAGGVYASTTSNNWGLNMDVDGNLSGFAWGENIGWINFSHQYDTVKVDRVTGKFSGFAWSETVGYLNFGDDSWHYGVRTEAFDSQQKGTPNWWLDDQNVAEEDDEGDSVPAWKEYVADTDPNDPNSFLHIMEIDVTSATNRIVFSPSSSQRYYTLMQSTNLLSNDWNPVSNQENIQYGTNGTNQLFNESTATQQFYRVDVKVAP